jgi:hypothetical protein
MDRREGVAAGYRKLGPTGRLIFWLTIASVVCTVVGFLAGLLFSEYYYIRSQRASRQLANVTMSRPVPFVRKFPVIVEDGTNMQIMPTPGRYVAAFSRMAFSFAIAPDGSINLRGEIRDDKGTIVAEAIGDSIRVIQSSRYDVNSDSKAIEVVDSSQRPLFQLMVIPYEDSMAARVQQRPAWAGEDGAVSSRQAASSKDQRPDEVIRLSYITRQRRTWLVSSGHGSEMVEVLDTYDWSKIPRLFSYPGYLHPGKRILQEE